MTENPLSLTLTTQVAKQQNFTTLDCDQSIQYFVIFGAAMGQYCGIFR